MCNKLELKLDHEMVASNWAITIFGSQPKKWLQIHSLKHQKCLIAPLKCSNFKWPNVDQKSEASLIASRSPGEVEAAWRGLHPFESRQSFNCHCSLKAFKGPLVAIRRSWCLSNWRCLKKFPPVESQTSFHLSGHLTCCYYQLNAGIIPNCQ